MISLKKILYEVLNNFSVEADIFIDPQYNTYDILNELRAFFIKIHRNLERKRKTRRRARGRRRKTARK